MSPLFLNSYNPDDVMHLTVVTLSAVLMLISINAYRKRTVSRYLFLMLAFIFFCLDQVVTLYQEIYFGGALIAIPFLNMHLIHFLELLMSVSFIVALVRPSGEPRT